MVTGYRSAVPKSERTPRKSTVRRRATILDAALRCFSRQGLAATTIADVRKMSKTSIGSIYHHFSSKEDLTSALYLHSLDLYQDGLLAKLERALTAERRVRTMVEYHLDWVAREPDRARFLFTAERPQTKSQAAHDLSRLDRTFFDRLFEPLEAAMHAGALRTLPRDLFLAMVMGPAQSYARAWLEGRGRSTLSRARRALADGAWAAVRTQR
jgi:AcrR family transcriptional regulator